MHATLVATEACAWPVLLSLPAGRLGLVFFNQPSHGFVEGDLAALTSEDGGLTWSHAGLAAPHEPGTNRMHIASGVDHAGNWIVLSTGFQVRDGRMTAMERVWCSTARAAGRDWKVQREVVVEGPRPFCIPHGRIWPVDERRLAATFYASDGRGRPGLAWLAKSDDGGSTWRSPADIGRGDANEVCLLPLAANHWLAAARTHVDHHVDLHASHDGGLTWQARGPLTLPMQHPADLTGLGDGQVLLTYGIRNRGLMGLGLRQSRDTGANWGPPAVLYQFGNEATDCGYPSTLHLGAGRMLTAAYSDHSPLHRGYHLLVLHWQWHDFFAPRPLRSISDGAPLSA